MQTRSFRISLVLLCALFWFLYGLFHVQQHCVAPLCSVHLTSFTAFRGSVSGAPTCSSNLSSVISLFLNRLASHSVSKEQMDKAASSADARFIIVDQVLYIQRNSSHYFIDHWRRMLLDLLSNFQVPNVEFVLSTGDEAHLPLFQDTGIFSFCTTPQHVNIPLPHPWYFRERWMHGSKGRLDTFAAVYPWEEKLNKMIYRSSINIAKSSGVRRQLFKLGCTHRDLIDAGVVPFEDSEQVVQEVFPELGECPLVSEYEPLDEQLRYKDHLWVEGNSCSWRLLNQLLGNSVLYMQQSKFMEFYSPLLQPYQHYIPVAENLSDLVSQIHWTRQHDKEAKTISRQATNFVLQNVEWDDMLCYIHSLLTAYSDKLQYTVTVPAAAERVWIDCGCRDFEL